MLLDNPQYRLTTATLNDASTKRFVIVDRDDVVHVASSWLGQMADVGASPNTVQRYGERVAAYLSWTGLTSDWRAIRISHLAMWRRTVATSPVVKPNGRMTLRGAKTISLYMTAVRSFYEWADFEGLLANDVASKITQIKYFAAGTPAGGERGAYRRILANELRPSHNPAEKPPQWIDDEVARVAIQNISLNTRDRFLIDLFTFTGIRAGEALSLFRSDMHFAGGSPENGCSIVDPHFHVRLDNPVENDVRAKGCERYFTVEAHLVERYIDLLIERDRILGGKDVSPHVFVNTYSTAKWQGRAMTYSSARKVVERCAKAIDFHLSGPHMLRHTFATVLVRGLDGEKVDLDVVQDLMGHKSITSTQKYTHDREEAKRAALLSIAPRSMSLRGEKI